MEYQPKVGDRVRLSERHHRDKPNGSTLTPFVEQSGGVAEILAVRRSGGETYVQLRGYGSPNHSFLAWRFEPVDQIVEAPWWEAKLPQSN